MVHRLVFCLVWTKYFLKEVKHEEAQLPLLVHSSKRVKILATKYLVRIFTPGSAPQKQIQSILGSKPRDVMSPQQLWYIFALAFACPQTSLGNGVVTAPPGGNEMQQMTELQRAIPYFREICLATHPQKYFLGMLSWVRRSEQTSNLHIQGLFFLNLCLVREPACFDLMEKHFEQLKVDIVILLLFIVTRINGNSSAAVQHPARFLSSTRTLQQQNAKLLEEGSELDKKGKTKLKAAQIEQLEGTLQRLVAIEDSLTSQAAAHPFLWGMLFVSFAAFILLFMHLICQLHPQHPMAEQPCQYMNDSPMFKNVDHFYTVVEPYAQKMEPHLNAARTAVQPAWLAAAPYLYATKDATVSFLGATETALSPYVASAEEATREHRATVAAWFNTNVVPLLDQGWTAAKPLIGKAGDALAEGWVCLSTCPFATALQ